MVYKLTGNDFIAMNPLSGAVDKVDENLAKVLERSNDDLTGVDLDSKNALMSRGYLYESEFEEEEILKRIAKNHDEQTLKLPDRFILILTYACNLNCSYCFQGESENDDRLMTSLMVDKAFDAISKINEEAARPSPEICIFGGEPLMRVRNQEAVLEKILAECNCRHYPVKIITNGVELEHFCKIMAEYNVKSIQVTLDGPKEVHDQRRKFRDGRGSFREIVRGIDLALDSDLKIELHVNIDSENIRYLPDLADFIIKKQWLENDGLIPYVTTVKNVGCRDYRSCIPEYELLSRVYEMLIENPELRIFILPGYYVRLSNGLYSPVSLPGGYGINCITSMLAHGKMPPPRMKNCGAHINGFAFDSYGCIYACGQISGRKEFSIGRFYPKFKLDDKRLLEWRNRSVLTVSHCKNCRLSLICGGGCAAVALRNRGSLYHPHCTDIEKSLKLGINFFLTDIKKIFEKGGE